MSLDIQLIGDDTTTDKCFCPHCGHEHVATHEDELYSSNITHNLARMAPTVGEWVEITPGGERPPAEGYSFLALADGTTFPGGYDPRRDLWCTDHGMHVDPVAYFVPPPYKKETT